jgi:hypothetical protein
MDNLKISVLIATPKYTNRKIFAIDQEAWWYVSQILDVILIFTFYLIFIL